MISLGVERNEEDQVMSTKTFEELYKAGDVASLKEIIHSQLRDEGREVEKREKHDELVSEAIYAAGRVFEIVRRSELKDPGDTIMALAHIDLFESLIGVTRARPLAEHSKWHAERARLKVQAALASAPDDDETVTVEDAKAIEEARSELSQ